MFYTIILILLNVNLNINTLMINNTIKNANIK